MNIGIKSLRCLIALSQHAITIVTCLSFIVSTTESADGTLSQHWSHCCSIPYIFPPLHLKLNEISTGMPLKKL